MKACSICNDFRGRSEYSSKQWKASGSLRICRQCEALNKPEKKVELSMGQREALARGAVQQLMDAIHQDLFPAKSVEGLFGISMNDGPIIDPMEMPLGQVVFNAWTTIIKIRAIVGEDELVSVLLRGSLKTDLKKWLSKAVSYYTIALLEHFDKITWWDNELLSRIAGNANISDHESVDSNSMQEDSFSTEKKQPPPPPTTTKNRATTPNPRDATKSKQGSSYIITRCTGRESCMNPIHGFIERTVSAHDHNELIRHGAIAPIPNLLGIKLRVVRLHPTLQPGILADNSVGVYLMADPRSGLAPPPWAAPGIGGLGSVDIIREDGDFGLVDAALLHDYMDDLMDRWGSGRPSERINPHAFQVFLRSRAAAVRNGQPSTMYSGEAAMIDFTDVNQLHLLTPPTTTES